MAKIKKLSVIFMCVCFLSLAMAAPSVSASSGGTTIEDIVTIWSLYLNTNNYSNQLLYTFAPHSPSFGYQLSAYSGAGFVTNFISFNGLPKNASYKICIDFTISGNVTLQRKTGHTTGNEIDYQTLYHETSFIYNAGS